MHVSRKCALERLTFSLAGLRTLLKKRTFQIELIKLGSSFSAISVDDSEDVPERSETPGGSSRMKQIEEQERNKSCSRTETPVPETSGTIGQVHYKYNQGFSNAVKKPVRMMDLLN